MPGISAVSPPISAQPACRQPSAMPAITRSATPGRASRGREIIEEEERLGALDDQIVGAHRDEIDADAVMAAAVDGELELGADAVIGGDQQRIAIARRLEIEEAAEAAERRVRARPRRRLGERRDRLHQRIAGGDVDARLGVGVAFARRSSGAA